MTARQAHRLISAAVLAVSLTLFVGLGALYLFVGHRTADVTAQTGNTWFTGVRWQPASQVFHAANFRVPDQQRHPVSLRQFRGKVVLLSFTSSVCRQQCPVIGRAMATTERLLGPAASQTVLLNVSVDPEADTKRTVMHFAHKMGWMKYHWYYLWTSRSRMKPIWKAYGIYVANPPPIYKPGLSIVHTAATAMIDQDGHVRGFFGYPFLPGQLAHGVQHLLREGA